MIYDRSLNREPVPVIVGIGTVGIGTVGIGTVGIGTVRWSTAKA